MTLADIYAAECNAVRLECLFEEAQNAATRLRLEYLAAVRQVRDLVRAAGESATDEVEQTVAPAGVPPAGRTLFDEGD